MTIVVTSSKITEPLSESLTARYHPGDSFTNKIYRIEYIPVYILMSQLLIHWTKP